MCSDLQLLEQNNSCLGMAKYTEDRTGIQARVDRFP